MASESQGQLKIISAPKILTLDNTPATIKQGTSYPYTSVDAEGNPKTEFKDVNLELQVTPHVTPDSRVAMEILVTNNELGAIINEEQSFTTKEAQTELSNVHEQITIEVTEAKESLLKEVDGFAKAIGEKILGRAF